MLHFVLMNPSVHICKNGPEIASINYELYVYQFMNCIDDVYMCYEVPGHG